MLINENKPYTVNQVSNEKPNVPKSSCTLTGFIAGSMNGGMNHVVTYKKVMAGERHREYKQTLKITTLTPLTPSYQNLYCTLTAYFVPNSRVWNNAEKYTAQKGGSAETKIKEIPNIGGKPIWKCMMNDNSEHALADQTTAWRDSFISSYLPRLSMMERDGTQFNYPKISILPLRGYKAIFNDFLRNKEYEPELTEYKSDAVSNYEWDTYNPLDVRNLYFHQGRAKRQNSYYTDYRTELQGFEETYPPMDMSADKSLVTWLAWENKVAEARSEASNAQANTWSIIAKIRGSREATQGKVQLLGKRTFSLNYAAVTQNAYNNSAEDINFKVLGKQGAYSYTEVEVPLYAGMEFIEEGYIHIIANVSADTVFEKGIDRNLLNVTPLDEYRPDLKDQKEDVLLAIEMGNHISMMIDPNFAVGFKRKFSEYFKLPNTVQGDMTNDNYFETDISLNHNNQVDMQTTEIITNKTYQFFEKDMKYVEFPDGSLHLKEYWKDYTDVMLNRNQAIMNDMSYYYDDAHERAITQVKGQNQIFYVGKAICDAELPIEGNIMNNFTDWGEH